MKPLILTYLRLFISAYQCLLAVCLLCAGCKVTSLRVGDARVTHATLGTKTAIPFLSLEIPSTNGPTKAVLRGYTSDETEGLGAATEGFGRGAVRGVKGF